jgi:hypothetical protein
MSEANVRVDAVMDEIERDVRARLQRHLVKKGAADFQDQAIFDLVHARLSQAVDRHDVDASLLAELVDSDIDWRLQIPLRLGTHRAGPSGRFILFAKRKLLLPLTRWLFEYSQENFRRQDRLNRILFACVEELAVDNARLRRDLESALQRPGQTG